MDSTMERDRSGPTGRTEPAEARARSANPRANLRIRLLAGDLAAATAAWGAAVWLLDGPDSQPATDALSVVLAVVLTIAALHWQRLYRSRVASNRSDEIARVGRACCSVGLLAAGADRVLGLTVDAQVFVGGGVLAFLLVAYQRGRFGRWVQDRRAAGWFGRSVLVVGDQREVEAIVDTFLESPELGYVPVPFVRQLAATEQPPGQPWSAVVVDVLDAVRSTGAGGVVIATASVPSTELNALVRALHRHRVHVHLSSGISGMHHRRLRVQAIGYEPFIYVEPATLSVAQAVAKRALDITVAAAALLVLAPLLLVVAALIKLDSPGPVVFRQERVGRRGRPFTILKLRTMCVDAEAQLVDLTDRNEREGPLFKVTDDPRVTRIGKALRATSIDELPQLLNVLAGTMSLVGPRPALPQEVGAFHHAAERHAVQPGITGLWQVEARDKPSFTAYERLDLFYVENWSIWLDIAVLMRTGRAVFDRARRAASAPRPSDAAGWRLPMSPDGGPGYIDAGVG